MVVMGSVMGSVMEEASGVKVFAAPFAVCSGRDEFEVS